MGKKHQWLKLSSVRTQPYRMEDISVIIPSAAGRFEKRWSWFWPQFEKRTNKKVLKNTYIPCDPEEVDKLTELTKGVPTLVPTEPRFIVNKTLAALEQITTRLTFRLANDIMVIRKSWERPLLKRFNDLDKLQVIAKVTHGVSYPQSQKALERDWKFIEREYKGKDTTAVVFPHGAVIMAQTGVWRGYYTHVPRYTFHDHDEIFFSQIARGDGIVFTNMTGIDQYLAHCGYTNQDFDPAQLSRIGGLRKVYEETPGNPGYKTL